MFKENYDKTLIVVSLVILLSALFFLKDEKDSKKFSLAEKDISKTLSEVEKVRKMRSDKSSAYKAAAVYESSLKVKIAEDINVTDLKPTIVCINEKCWHLIPAEDTAKTYICPFCKTDQGPVVPIKTIPDSDDDGISNALENRFSKCLNYLNPKDADMDFDYDGISALDELSGKVKYNPTDRNSFPSLAQLLYTDDMVSQKLGLELKDVNNVTIGGKKIVEAQFDVKVPRSKGSRQYITQMKIVRQGDVIKSKRDKSVYEVTKIGFVKEEIKKPNGTVLKVQKPVVSFTRSWYGADRDGDGKPDLLGKKDYTVNKGETLYSDEKLINFVFLDATKVGECERAEARVGQSIIISIVDGAYDLLVVDGDKISAKPANAVEVLYIDQIDDEKVIVTSSKNSSPVVVKEFSEESFVEKLMKLYPAVYNIDIKDDEFKETTKKEFEGPELDDAGEPILE